MASIFACTFPGEGGSGRAPRPPDPVKERAAGRSWFRSLSTHDRWVLGDQLVLGDFLWIDWLDRKPSPSFLRGVDDERILWEQGA